MYRMRKGTGPISLPISLQTAPTPTNGWRSLHKTWMLALLLLKQVGVGTVVSCHFLHEQAVCNTDIKSISNIQLPHSCQRPKYTLILLSSAGKKHYMLESCRLYM